jgi:hypothetical protein
MRLLLDECVPRKFKQELPGHEVKTAAEMGWSGKRNGELLTLMRKHRFEAFVTVDQNVKFQQNVKASGIAVVVLAARSNRLKELRPLAPAVLRALSTIRSGQLERIGA